MLLVTNNVEWKVGYCNRIDTISPSRKRGWSATTFVRKQRTILFSPILYFHKSQYISLQNSLATCVSFQIVIRVKLHNIRQITKAIIFTCITKKNREITMFRNIFMKMAGVCKAEWFVHNWKKGKSLNSLNLTWNIFFLKIITLILIYLI